MHLLLSHAPISPFVLGNIPETYAWSRRSRNIRIVSSGPVSRRRMHLASVTRVRNAQATARANPSSIHPSYPRPYAHSLASIE